MSSIAIAIASASLEDVPELLEMMRDFNALEQIPFSAAGIEPALRRLLVAPDLGYVGRIARSPRRTRRGDRPEGGRMIGYFILTWGFDLEWNGRDAFLTEIYLVPEARGRGAGQAAMAAIEGIARDAGARALHLMVRHENDAAQLLYTRAGFETPPRRFMTKDLRSDPNPEPQ
jgi:ribosomal protein S18 acetylase RimI-like enzyme